MGNQQKVIKSLGLQMFFKLFIYFSSFSLGLCSDPFMFQVRNANLTIQLLKQLNFWQQELESDHLLFENPVRNFLLIKMLRVDIEDYMIPRFLRYQFRKNVKVPRSDDLRKSAILINDMKNMYNIPILKIIKSLGIGDCWTLIDALCEEGLVDAAEQWLNDSRDFYVNHTKDLFYFDDVKMKIEDKKFEDDLQKKFDSLCSYQKGCMNLETFKNASTKCRWVQDGRNPLIRFNVEELSPEPVVKIVHNFISNGEIQELLKKMSKYDFDVAPTVAGNEDTNGYSKARIARSHYINEEEDNVGDLARKLKLRMQRISGINMDHSEDLEIVKYRPGGVHSPHVDQYQDEEELMLESPIYGNRYAQGLIFLQKPELGGNFAMPLLGLSIVPTPGALVVWHNADNEGHMDQRSHHGGCKVFVGHKIAGSTCGLMLDQNMEQSALRKISLEKRINQTLCDSFEL